MSKIVYFDDEMSRMYSEIKDNNPDFNFSGFVKKIMKVYNLDGEKIDLEKIQHTIKNLDLDIEKLQEKKRYLLAKIKEDKENKTHEKDLKQKDIEYFTSSFKKYFDFNDVQAEEYANKYWDVQSEVGYDEFVKNYNNY